MMEFRIKAIPKKKTNPQRKMKQFFSVTKPIPKQVEKNFQGFPLAECVYEEEIDETVYSPPDWGFTEEDGSRSDWDFCQKCLLRPCLVKEKFMEIFEFAENLELFAPGGNDNEAIVCKTFDHVEALLVGVFGVRYVRRRGLPLCVQHAVVGKYPHKEPPHPDDDLFIDSEEEFAAPLYPPTVPLLTQV
jgi:hypothetical protein